MNVLGKVQAEANAEVYAVASGAIGTDKTCIVNTDGTVSSIFSNLTIFNAASTFTPSIATNGSGTFLIIYVDGGNSNAGMAVAGTISGSSVTLGTAVQLTSGMANSRQSTSVVYDPDTWRPYFHTEDFAKVVFKILYLEKNKMLNLLNFDNHILMIEYILYIHASNAYIF